MTSLRDGVGKDSGVKVRNGVNRSIGERLFPSSPRLISKWLNYSGACTRMYQDRIKKVGAILKLSDK